MAEGAGARSGPWAARIRYRCNECDPAATRGVGWGMWMRGNPRFLRGLPENLVAVPPRRRARFGPGNMGYGGVFGPLAVVKWGRSGPDERRLSFLGPIRTLLSNASCGSQPRRSSR